MNWSWKTRKSNASHITSYNRWHANILTGHFLEKNTSWSHLKMCRSYGANPKGYKYNKFALYSDSFTMKTEVSEVSHSFEIIKNSLSRNGLMLFDNLGFCYHLHFTNKNPTVSKWVCSKKAGSSKGCSVRYVECNFWIKQNSNLDTFSLWQIGLIIKSYCAYFRCRAGVHQVRDVFIISDKPHMCQSNPNIIHTLLLRQRINLLAEKSNDEIQQKCAEKSNDKIQQTCAEKKISHLK